MLEGEGMGEVTATEDNSPEAIEDTGDMARQSALIEAYNHKISEGLCDKDQALKEFEEALKLMYPNLHIENLDSPVE